MLKRLLSVFCLAAMAACAPMQEKPAAETTATAQPTAAESCAAKGGQLTPVCRMGKVTCVVSYSDAGKSCADGSQCLSGKCVRDETGSGATDEIATGVCKATDNPCGCFTLIQNGKAAPTLCVD
jgi:hypothetical protein